jgi:putative ABC transport system permease protein
METHGNRSTLRIIETFFQDLRYGLRKLRRSPGYAAVVLITLALGIGANTSMFSVVNAILVQPLPFKDPGRLVEVWQTLPQKGQYEDPVCYRNVVDWIRDNHSFDGMAAYRAFDATLTGENNPAVVPGAAVSGGLFHVLGVRPMLGRPLLPADDEPGSTPVALLGEGIWRSRFGADLHILGRTLEVDQKPFTVVGVLPASFRFPYQGSPTELWLPIIDDPEVGPLVMRRGPEFWQGIGRLKRGETIKQAEEDLNLVARHLAAQFPQTNKGSGVNVVPLQTQLVENVKPALEVLLGAVFLVLLIACVNVANLSLARSASRTREIAVRTALGASGHRIIRQLLSESVLLGVLGGTAGLLIAPWATMALVRLSPASLPQIHTIRLDGWVLAFTIALSLGAGVIVGLAPAFVASKPDLQQTLKEGGRSLAEGRKHNRFRGILVVSEIALALVLSVGAGLLIRSLVHLMHVDLGFNPAHVLTAQISLPQPSFSNMRKQALFYDQVLQRLKALPGVTNAAATTAIPLSGAMGVSFAIPGRPAGNVTGYSSVSQGYFRTMGIPVIKGRSFSGHDDAASLSVAIINRTFARRFFPSASPLGQHLMLNGFEGNHKRQIVGVVGDVRQSQLAGTATPQVYVPYTQSPIPFWGGMSFVLRTPLRPNALEASVRKQVYALDNEIPVEHLQPMDAWIKAAGAPSRFDALLLGIFAGLALVLAAIGIYGVISYSVAQHTHDIGIRMALGAQKGDVLRLVITEGMTLAAIGVAIGIIAALGLTRLLSSQLYGVKPTDPITFVAVAIILSGTALFACYIPAQRATKLDPMVALRHD